jgi:O-acetyl-ADP-ribose deacetylase (regulator of RNase III)
MPGMTTIATPQPMITYVYGDLFRSPAKVLVNTVNTKGVMGKGLARDFKAIYPEMFEAYQKLCEARRFDVGQLHLFRTLHKWVLNFPTKKDWKRPSRPEYIEAGLKAFVQGYAKLGITSVAFPQLGCGHGELDWERQVRPLMEQYLSRVPIPIYIHLYRPDVFPKEHHDLEGTRAWLHQEPESLGFDEVWDDLATIAKDPAKGFRMVDSPEPAIEFPDGRAVTREVMLDLWQQFRDLGFLIPENLVADLQGLVPRIFPMLLQLPYVRAVHAARGRAPTDERFTMALQLVPRALPDDPLFRRAVQSVVHA